MAVERELGFPSKSTVGIVISSDLIEDWLDHIRISLGEFLDEIVGGWIFGYIKALKTVDVESVVFCVSDQVLTTTRFHHRPTGAVICLLPATRLYKALRWTRDLFHNSNFIGSYWIKVALKLTTAYLATPVGSFWLELYRQPYSAILVEDYETARFDVCVLIGKLAKIPIYGTFQGAGSWGRIFDHLRSQTIKRCAGLIIAAEAEAERVKNRHSLPSTKVARIYNPLDIDMWRPVEKLQARCQLGIPDTAEVAIWHGRIDLVYKGLDILIEAWEHVCRMRPTSDVRLFLIGMGPDTDKLDSIIQKRNVRGIVRVNRWIHDTKTLRQYLGCADLFVFSSRGEGFPVAPIEAMACGLPVVASDASGVQDILTDGCASGGIIVPRNDPTALSVQIVRVLNDTAWRDELGKRARRRVESAFSVNMIGSQLAVFLSGSGVLNAPH